MENTPNTIRFMLPPLGIGGPFGRHDNVIRLEVELLRWQAPTWFIPTEWRRSMQKPKTKLEAKPESSIVIRQPMVRNFSTGGGHGPEDTIVEGDGKLVT